MVENNYEINFAETTDEIFRGKLENVTRIDQTSLFLEGQNREVKMSVSKSVSNGKLSQTFFFTTVVIDHNFIPASQLSQTPSPSIRLYLLIPRSKFLTQSKLFDT